MRGVVTTEMNKVIIFHPSYHRDLTDFALREDRKMKFDFPGIKFQYLLADHRNTLNELCISNNLIKINIY